MKKRFVIPDPGDSPAAVLRQLAEEMDQEAKYSTEMVIDCQSQGYAGLEKVWQEKVRWEKRWASRLRGRATRIEGKAG